MDVYQPGNWKWTLLNSQCENFNLYNIKLKILKNYKLAVPIVLSFWLWTNTNLVSLILHNNNNNNTYNNKQYCDYLWIKFYSKLNISSTRVRHRAGSRDEMRWSPPIEGLWITRMPPDHAWRTITGTNETKWMRWMWKNGGMKFVVGENERKPEKTYTDSVSSTKPTWSDKDANSWLQR